MITNKDSSDNEPQFLYEDNGFVDVGGSQTDSNETSMVSESAGLSGPNCRACTVPNCKRRVRSRGLCKAHGGGRRCMVEGCDRSSQGQGLCIRHGGGKRCNHAGCTKASQSNGLCKAHGGGIRCHIAGCNKSSQGGGLCRAHGGGQRCEKAGCTKGAQRGGYCASHGGSRFCQHADCTKNDRGGGFCAEHGGGKRCDFQGCNKPARKKGKCSFHATILSKNSQVKLNSTESAYSTRLQNLAHTIDIRVAGTPYPNGGAKHRYGHSTQPQGYSGDPYLHIQTDQRSYDHVPLASGIIPSCSPQYSAAVSNAIETPSSAAIELHPSHNRAFQTFRPPAQGQYWSMKDPDTNPMPSNSSPFTSERQIYGYAPVKHMNDPEMQQQFGYQTEYSGTDIRSIRNPQATHEVNEHGVISNARGRVSHYVPSMSEMLNSSTQSMGIQSNPNVMYYENPGYSQYNAHPLQPMTLL